MAGARLTCGQPIGQATFTQVSPKREDLTSSRLASSALTSANAYWSLWCPQPSSDHDCPCVTAVGRSLSHADRTPRLRARGSRPLSPELAALSGSGPWYPPLPPIGLTAAGLSAGGEVSRAGSRVRSPGIFTCARCPAVRSALDAGLEAYHNPAAVWWGALAASPVIRDQVVIVEPVAGLLGQQRRRQDRQLRRSVCAADRPACPQVSRYIGLSGSDREFPESTG